MLKDGLLDVGGLNGQSLCFPSAVASVAASAIVEIVCRRMDLLQCNIRKGPI